MTGNSSLVRRGTAASVALLIVVLAAWQWGPGLLGIPIFIIPPLSAVFDEFLRMLAVSALMTHTGVTALEVIAGFLLGSLLGAFFGYVLGMSPTAEFALSPYILALQIAPKVAFAPLFVMWFGLGVAPKIVLVVLFVFFVVFMNTAAGLYQVNPQLVDVVRVMGARRTDVVWKIALPSTVPYLITGLRIAIPEALVGAVIGEFIAANRGLGYLVNEAANELNVSVTMAAIVALLLIVVAMDIILGAVERRLLRWRPAQGAPIGARE